MSKRQRTTSTETNTTRGQVIKYSKGQLIGHSSDTDIRTQLLRAYNLIGITAEQYPTPEADQGIFKSLRSMYGKIGINELSLAFELATCGMLGIPEKDLKHYGPFNMLYLGRIMNYYKRFRGPILVKEAEKPKEASKEEKDAIYREFIKVCFYNPLVKYIQTKEYTFAGSSVVHLYDLLDGEGIKLTKEQKAEYAEKAKERVLEQAKMPPSKKEEVAKRRILQEMVEKQGDKHKDVVSLAKKMAFKDWLDASISKGLMAKEITSKLKK